MHYEIFRRALRLRPRKWWEYYRYPVHKFLVRKYQRTRQSLVTQLGSIGNLVLVHGDFSKAPLQSLDFSCSDFRHADLNGADLEGASLFGCTIAHANFFWTRLPSTHFWLVKGWESAEFGICDWTKAEFQDKERRDWFKQNVDDLLDPDQRLNFTSLSTRIRSVGKKPT